jgi:2,4-dienoyl-CoA reductase-like NADH-dependent reductase (Old Yellow Enzyme family)
VTAREDALLFQPFPLGAGGRRLANRIWLPAMVTWRGTEDGYVTPAVREIYLRYAQGGAGMIVLEATGVRDVASGPLLRLSHDRFVPGLRALREEMRAASDALAVPQIIDFLKIARRKPTRAFMEQAVGRSLLHESVLALTDAEFEGAASSLLTPRALRDFLHGYRQTIEDLEPSEIASLPGWFADAARRAEQAGFDGVELHFAHAYTMAAFLSVTNGRRDRYGGSLENRLRLPLEVVRVVRESTDPGFLVAAYLGPGHPGRGRQYPRQHRGRRLVIGVALARAGLDFLSISRGGKFEDAKQPPVGEAAYPYTGHSGHACIPRDKRAPFGVNVPLAAAIRRAVRAAGFTTPVVTSGKIVEFSQAEAILRAGDADLIGMARALLADPDLPRKWRAGPDAAAGPACSVPSARRRTSTTGW